MTAASRDLAQRSRGVVARTRARFEHEHVSDNVLTARVRERLGRMTANPGALTVNAENGRVTVSGPILAQEVDDVLCAVRSVRGVSEVVGHLEVHERPNGVPALQGGPSQSKWRAALGAGRWSPAARMLAGGAGVALLGYAGSRRNTPAALLGVAGAGLLARAMTDVDVRRLVGAGTVELQKTISIGAPVEQVYARWERYEDFPHMMTHVREVRRVGTDGRTHWVIQLPGGVPIEFDAVPTRSIPDRLLGWRSVGDSLVRHAGVVRFDPNPDGSTRIQVSLSYTAPGGVLGHAVAALVGADAKSLLDDDLARLKTTIETGRPPHDAAQPSISEETATPAAEGRPHNRD